MAVTELILISIGANMDLASRSHKRQETAPPRKDAGITVFGFVVLNKLMTRCGTATPTKAMGPAKAVTVADKTLEISISKNLNLFILSPTLKAY